MAGVLSVAVPLLSEQSSTSDEKGVAWLVDRIRERHPKAIYGIARTVRLSPRLTQRIAAYVERPSLTSIGGLGRDRVAYVKAENIPQLVWQDAFELHLKALVPGTRADFARRFCALALVRLCEGTTWRQAARALDLPEQRAEALARECATRIRQAGHEDAFVAGLRLVAEWARSRPIVDYAHRREALRTLITIEAETWASLCDLAGVSLGKPNRRRYAAAWVWCELTEGDYRLAPALAECNRVASTGPRPASQYRRYVKAENVFAQMKDVLLEYGSTLLSPAGEEPWGEEV
jgi:hypothetical protein